jgi:hypothetical protein
MIAVIDREENTRYLTSGAKYIPSIFTKLSQLRRALPSSNTKPRAMMMMHKPWCAVVPLLLL